MASRLIPITVSAPGIKGLNLQELSSLQGPEWCRVGTNLVIDETGRIATRNGWAKSHTTAISNTPDVLQVFEYKPNTGNNVDIFCADSKIWKDRTSPTDITGSVSVTGDNWKFQNFNGKVVGFQALHEPIIWNGTGNFTYLVDEHTAWSSGAYVVGNLVVPTTHNGYYYECTTAGTSGGSEPTWDTTPDTGTTTDGGVTWTTREIPKSNEVLAAYGRIWVVDPSDNSTFWYSDLLIPQSFVQGSSGGIDLKSVWTRGQDRIVALAAFNNSLVIFGNDTTTVYDEVGDFSTIHLAEVVYDIGCIARDSVQYVDEDMFFLSRTGVRSYKRTILRDKLPQADITKNVRDDIIGLTVVDDVDNIRSVYDKLNGLYLVTFPASAQLYCVDIKKYVSTGEVRVFKWDSMDPLALHSLENGTILAGFTAGWVGTLTGHSDNEAAYIVDFDSGWTDIATLVQDASLAARLIMLKKYEAVLRSSNSINPSLSWNFNQNDLGLSRQISFIAGDASEYGLAEYGIGEYGGSATAHTFSVNASGSGRTFSFGISISVNGAKVSYQYANLMFKLGRAT